MEPSPDQVIEAIAYTFEHDIMPEISTAWARRMASTLLWALDHLRQRFLHEHAFAIEENRQLKALIRTMGDQSEDSARLTEVLRTSLPADLPLAERSWPMLQDVVQENHRLRQAVEAVIVAFPGLGGDGAAAALWHDITQYIQAQTERDAKLSAETEALAWMGAEARTYTNK